MPNAKLNLEELQKIELDILIYLDKVCKENNLTYYLASGTLLGAVKYKGFIPWDDDIDVILLRDDYMKLMDLLKNTDGDYKLLSIYNCKDYYYSFAKIVDTRTTLTENSKPISGMGVYIDVIPMDGYIGDDIELQIHKMRFIKNMMVRRYRIKNCIRKDFDYINFDKKKVRFQKVKDLIYQIIDIITLPLGYNFWTKLYDQKNSKISIADAEYLGVKSGSFGIRETFKKEDIIESALYEFEGHKFTSFKNYDLYLTSKFGDYRKDPSEDQKKTHHQFDAYRKDV